MYYFLVITPFILVIISLIVYLVYSYDKIYNFLPPNVERFSKRNSSLLSSGHYKNYLASVDPNIYKVKCPTYKNNFVLDYSRNIKNLPNKYKSLVSTYIKHANKVTHNLPIFRKEPWNIYVSINNLEMNMPYTIDNYIIVSLKDIKDLYPSFKKGHIDNHFVNTLVHEKIHVIQRNRQRIFDKFYKQYYSNFIDSQYYKEIPKKLRETNMNNPDSNNTHWIYKYNQKKYLPLLTHTNGSVTEIGYNIKNVNDIIYLNNIKKKFGFDNHISFYHPNEIFACEVAHQIMTNKLEYKYKNLLRRL